MWEKAKEKEDKETQTEEEEKEGQTQEKEEMKILVISDTHIPHRARELPEILRKEVEGADMVIHAGDFTSYDFYLELMAYNSNLHAVYGNMDDPDLFRTLPEKKILTVENVKIGIIHGFGAPLGLEKRVMERFKDEEVDIIVFGHSHRPLLKKEGEILLLNPGSPTDTIFTKRRSYAILTIEKGEVEGNIIYLD